MISRDCNGNDFTGITILILELNDIELGSCRFCGDLFIKDEYPKRVNNINLNNCPCRIH